MEALKLACHTVFKEIRRVAPSYTSSMLLAERGNKILKETCRDLKGYSVYYPCVISVGRFVSHSLDDIKLTPSSVVKVDFALCCGELMYFFGDTMSPATNITLALDNIEQKICESTFDTLKDLEDSVEVLVGKNRLVPLKDCKNYVYNKGVLESVEPKCGQVVVVNVSAVDGTCQFPHSVPSGLAYCTLNVTVLKLKKSRDFYRAIKLKYMNRVFKLEEFSSMPDFGTSVRECTDKGLLVELKNTFVESPVFTRKFTLVWPGVRTSVANSGGQTPTRVLEP